ncbi:DUF3306 domain-containing protein [Photobacterium sp. S4TG1]|uniref:DUF3306 domain-containing protein n=1 Tax=Photobacterium sp. S4TG1 TaxID=3114587 RepID=UPI002E16F224|nr:DUF3306 domain-containing protein [Photobacterium sp. S4TG1]
MATNFFQRWSSRKLTPVESLEPTTETTDDAISADGEKIESTSIAVNEVTDVDENESTSAVVTPCTEVEVIELTVDDADKVTYDSGVASFMQQQVTKSVKKAALRKLFHSEEFNYISDMDDSTEDFSNMQGLAPEIASQMRGWINTITETATEALKNDGISALTSTTELNTTDSIIEPINITHTDKEAHPTADLSLTPILNCDNESDEQKS